MRKLGIPISSLLIVLLVLQSFAPVLEAQTGVPSAEELDQLLAPVALYPDSLLSQITTASTNPQEILDADNWLHQHRGLTGTALTDAAEKQGFDPAFIALVNFPSVLAMMAQNVDDYAAIGDAFLADQGAVSASIQRLRAQAYEAGTLRSNSQQEVQLQPASGQTVYVIQPANPQVVYVPQYDPTVVYVRSAAPPATMITFGVGIGIGALMVSNQPWVGAAGVGTGALAALTTTMATGEDGGGPIVRLIHTIGAGQSYGRTGRDIAAPGVIARADIVRRIILARVRSLVREHRVIRELHRGRRLRALVQNQVHLRQQDRECLRIRAGRRSRSQSQIRRNREMVIRLRSRVRHVRTLVNRRIQEQEGRANLRLRDSPRLEHRQRRANRKSNRSIPVLLTNRRSPRHGLRRNRAIRTRSRSPNRTEIRSPHRMTRPNRNADIKRRVVDSAISAI